ncbi:MAG: hypothetical protein ACK5LR_09300 [Mangrovibacterium sp.]
MNKIITLLLALGFSCATWAQKLEQKQTDEQQQDSISYQVRLWGIGGGKQQVSFLSPLVYENMNFSTSRSKYRQFEGKITSKNSYTNMLLAQYPYGEGDLDITTAISLQYQFILNKRYLINTNFISEGFPALSVGWAYWFDWGIDVKASNANNPYYFNLNNMTGLSVGLEKKLIIGGRQFNLYNEFTLPLVGIYMGSEYSSSFPYILSEKDANPLDGFRIGSFKTNFQLHNDFNVDIKLKAKKRKPERTMRLRYSIDYMNLNLNNNHKQVVLHTFSIGYPFNRSNYVHK